MSKSLFIGRWQPFHDGHRALIDHVLNEDKSVIIAVRDTEISESNPFTTKECVERIEYAYRDNPKV